MRKYQPIWNLVKKELSASLAADPSTHWRIIQAVRKEKNKDPAWLDTNIKSKNPYELRTKREGTLLTFNLVQILPHKTKRPIGTFI